MIDLKCGDCIELLGMVKDNSVDLVIIDPPYEIAGGGGGGGAFGADKRNYHQEYLGLYKKTGKTEETERLRILSNTRVQRDNLKFVSKGFDMKLLDELDRIMKKTNIYIWCSKAQVGKIINYYENKKCFIDILTWHKTNPIPTCNNTYLSDTEYCIFIREKGVKVLGTYKTKRKYYVTPINVQDKKLYKHPTIKPLNIIENLIINSSKEGDVVLDCFMGSGTTGVAAKKLKRDFIGIEIDKEFFKIAKERIETNEKY